MTPKEKAIELYEKFYYKIPTLLDDKTLDCLAQECALIAVDEIIITCAFYDYKSKSNLAHCFEYNDNYFVTYWQEVRREIQNL